MVYQLHLALHVRARVHEASHVALRHEIHDLIPLVGRLHRGVASTLYNEVFKVVGDEAVPQRPRRSSEMLFFGVEDHAHVGLDSSPMAAEETRDSPAAGVAPVLISVAGP